ncbi:MAG: hypothetical protein WBG48_07620 [Pricia sp.]
MRKKFKSTFTSAFIIMVLALFATGCSNDDGSIFETPTEEEQENPENPGETPDEPEVATLIFNEANPTENKITAEASGEVGTNVEGRVIFTSSETTQRRMYITQNISGSGDMPFNVLDIDDPNLKDETKGDGSIDLDGSNQKDIDFTFELPVPDIDNGEIVYTFWTTTGKGDFRDASKRLALGVGTITVTVGNGTNPAAEVRDFTDIRLFAPAEDGTTKTFFSLLNETVYRIDEGREFRAFWDFGYYYKDNQASFASTANYDAAFGFPVEGLKPDADEMNAETETLNNMFFAESSLDADGFDGVLLSGDLNNITSSDVEDIDGLAVGDVIEFVDNYGKKGLIKITAIDPGFSVVNSITFDVKIQP